MEYPRLTEEQLRLNNSEFNALIANVRRLNSGVADMLMTNRYKLEQHVKALDTEANVIDAYQAHETMLLARLRKAEKEVVAHGQEIR